ncbi:MAG: hypothetical protein QOF48_2572 [Verrucomicrobiota bacterium]|jgi:hypothetical protein
MFRRHSLNNLLLRKQLLISEAEVHREQMRHDLRLIREELSDWGNKARSFGIFASVLGVVVGGVTALRGIRKTTRRNEKRSLISRLFSGVRLASTMWQGWSSIKHARENSAHSHNSRL